jgi:iron-sulfur cluster repair protein YtfE (RIC family)
VKITDALLGEHGALYAQFARLETELPRAAGAAEVREQAGLLASALISHAALEDELLFERLAREPAVDRGLLAAMADEHGRIAAALARAEATANLEEGRSLVLDAVGEAREHFAKEERMVFPLVESVLDAAVLAELGEAWAARRAVFLEP